MNRRFDPGEPELMDRPGELTNTWRRDLANLRSLNRWFGAHRIIRWYFRGKLKRGGHVRVLDLATGSGDLPRLVMELGNAAGCRVEIDAVDRHPATLGAAREWCAGVGGIRFIEADAREFEADQPYDHVLCSLALHHFSEGDAVTVLRRAMASAGPEGGVLVADLARSWSGLAGIYFITSTVFRDSMTVTDARMSAQAAFSMREMAELARRAGWGEGFGRRGFRWGRQAIWLGGGSPAPDENVSPSVSVGS